MPSLDEILDEIERSTGAFLESPTTFSSTRRRAAIDALSSAGPMTPTQIARLERAHAAGEIAAANLRRRRAELVESLERLRAHARWLEESHLGRTSFPGIELEG